jgi:hypothetical protein
MPNTTHTPSLAGLHKVCCANLTLSRTRHGGWRLSEYHRHHTGNWGECERVDYEALTTGELVDVLCALVDEYETGVDPVEI